MRVQKYLSACGACSRRKAEEAVGRGEVTIDGELALIGQSVVPGESIVTLCGESVEHSKKKIPTVLAMHKPRGYVCTHCDPHIGDGESIYALLKGRDYGKLICCGRLDKDSEGLIILADSGALAAKLMHPSGNVEKFYVVTVDKPISRCHCKWLRDGVDEGGEFLGVHSLSAIPGSSRSLAITLHCGKKRHIRRMLAAFGYEVKRLVRHRIGDFSLGSLAPGKCKRLNESLLKRLLNE